MLTERYISDSGLLIGIFFLLLFTLSVLLKYSNKNIAAILGSFISEKAFEKKTQEEYFLRNYASITLFIIGIISITTNIYFITKDNINISAFSLLVSIGLLISTRLIFISILSRFISIRGTILKAIFYSEVIFVQFSGVVFLTLMLTQLWVAPNMQLLIVSGVGVGLLFLKWIRQMRISFLGRIGLFYNILYFCALELIPILIFIKITQSV